MAASSEASDGLQEARKLFVFVNGCRERSKQQLFSAGVFLICLRVEKALLDMGINVSECSIWVMVQFQQFFLRIGDFLTEIGKGYFLIQRELVQFNAHLVVPPGDFRLGILLYFGLLFLLERRTDQTLPFAAIIVDNAGLALVVVITDKVTAEGEIVG